MIGFISFLALFIGGAVILGFRVRQCSDRNKFIRLTPYWVLVYGVSLAMICPVAFFRFWEYNLDFILLCLFLGCAFISAILLFATFIASIRRGQYGNMGRILGIGVLLIIYSFICMLFAGMGEGAFDYFGRRHPIPQDLECYEPYTCRNRKYLSQQDSITVSRGILLEGEQGMYSYRALVPAIPEKGEIFLKLYESTSNFPLSEANVRRNSTLSVEPSDTAVIYQMEEGNFSVTNYDKQYYFTIEEGSWGDYYAARVELWYQPISGNEPQLLNTAIYKIEGWSR